MHPAEEEMLRRMLYQHLAIGGPVGEPMWAPRAGRPLGGGLGGAPASPLGPRTAGSPGFSGYGGGAMATAGGGGGSDSGGSAPPPGMGSASFGQSGSWPGMIANNNSFVAQVPTSNINFNPGQFQGAMGTGAGDISSASSALRDRIAGKSPSVAEQQLRQSTQGNIANAYAMAQGSGDAGAARNAANQAAQLNQQGAQQGALLRAGEQEAATSQLGQLGLGAYGTAGSLYGAASGRELGQSQGNQNAALQAQNLNAQVGFGNQAAAAGQLQQGVQLGANLAGAAGTGLASLARGWGNNSSSGDQPASPGGGSAGPGPIDPNGAPYYIDNPSNPSTPPSSSPTDIPYYRGGLVRHYDIGGTVAPGDVDYSTVQGQSTGSPLWRNSVPSTAGGAPAPLLGVPPRAQADPLNTGAVGAIKTGIGLIPIGGSLALAGGSLMDKNKDIWSKPGPFAIKLAQGGNVHPVHAMAHHASALSQLMSMGGGVPGHAQQDGNHLANDTVPAMLSPGEIVLPRSVTQDEDAAEKARLFVEAIQKRKAP